MDEPETDQIGIEERLALPVPVLAADRQPVRGSAPAPFVSQLIAARARLEAQRVRRRAPVDTALGAYAEGAQISVRRMPAGYRKTVVV
jgi:hypothetical protein